MDGAADRNDFELRPATVDDEPFLEALDADVRQAELGLAGLPPGALASLLAMQYKARKFGYAAQFPGAENSIVWVEQERVGRLLVHEDADGLRIVDVALLSRFRGLGIGTRLLQEVYGRAQTKGLPVRLAVRVDNPAQRLYQRLGFVATGSNGLDLQMEWRLSAG